MVVRNALALVAVLSLVGPLPGAEEAEPLDVGLQEEVQVRFVLVDVLVLDQSGRTIPDLTLADFDLVVDGRPVEIDTLDTHCPLGRSDDVRAEDHPGLAAGDVSPETQRIVLVFDYFHMQNAADALEAAAQAVATRRVEGVQHMVVSLGQTLQVQTPFSVDPDEILRTLTRMRNDPLLYAGNYGRLTERRFFDRVRRLLDVLEQLPGRKQVVLFSGPFMPDGFHHDLDYRDLAAMSAISRSAIYPVDSGGMRALNDPRHSSLGGPPNLRRLAIETGGRMTADTNDIALAYVRAQRDLGCSYTLGFYDRRPRLDRPRRVTVYLHSHRGLRPYHPVSYVVRSREKKRKSLFRTAIVAPGFFDSPALTANVFLLQPRSAKRWEALIALDVRLDPRLAGRTERAWDARGVLRKPNGTIVRSFKRSVEMAVDAQHPERLVTRSVFETVSLRPGHYTLSVALSDPSSSEPLATHRPIVIPDIPHERPFLVGPLVGRPRSPGDEGGEGAPEFEPLVIPRVTPGAELASLTRICHLGHPGDSTSRMTVGREVTGGTVAHTFDPVTVALTGEGRVRCRSQIDWLRGLAPGDYEVSAYAASGTVIAARGRASFTILPRESE